MRVWAAWVVLGVLGLGLEAHASHPGGSHLTKVGPIDPSHGFPQVERGRAGPRRPGAGAPLAVHPGCPPLGRPCLDWHRAITRAFPALSAEGSARVAPLGCSLRLAEPSWQ